MPGRRTRRSRSHCQAASKSTLGPSPRFQARLSSHDSSSERVSANLPIAVETLDLGRVFPVGLAALSVLGETAHIWETQLCRDVGGSPRGYVPDIRQEPAESANRAELYRRTPGGWHHAVADQCGFGPRRQGRSSAGAQPLRPRRRSHRTRRPGSSLRKSTGTQQWYRTPDHYPLACVFVPLFPNPQHRQYWFESREWAHQVTTDPDTIAECDESFQ